MHEPIDVDMLLPTDAGVVMSARRLAPLAALDGICGATGVAGGASVLNGTSALVSPLVDGRTGVLLSAIGISGFFSVGAEVAGGSTRILLGKLLCKKSTGKDQRAKVI